MPKHEAATWFEKADAETRSRHSIAETRALTVSSQGRHSQGRNSRGQTARELRY
jgi:Flp pilus assembly protein TadD